MKRASVTESELRAVWRLQGVPKKKQDKMIADIVAKAQPGAILAMLPASPIQFEIERTPAGPQRVIPGAEKSSSAVMAQRKADAPLKPKVCQRACDAGLFSDDANQIDFLSFGGKL